MNDDEELQRELTRVALTTLEGADSLSPRFAQLRVTIADSRSVHVDLAVDWRERDPVTLAIGPVLSIEDAVGSKVGALYSRTEARDYIDVDAIRGTGRFTDAELMTAAAGRDAGFDRDMFARQLEQVHRRSARKRG